MSRALIIFIKNPRKGFVKSRLAESIGAEAALRVYMELIRHTRMVTHEVDCIRMLFYSDYIDENDGWPGEIFEKCLQVGYSLGERMESAFRHVFDNGCKKAVIVGSDCPGITTELIESAFSLLDEHDFVIGPAADGGYYLLGMRQLHAAVFKHKYWSTPAVLNETLNDFRKMERTFATLPQLVDVDDLNTLSQTGWAVRTGLV